MGVLGRAPTGQLLASFHISGQGFSRLSAKRCNSLHNRGVTELVLVLKLLSEGLLCFVPIVLGVRVETFKPSLRPSPQSLFEKRTVNQVSFLVGGNVHR